MPPRYKYRSSRLIRALRKALWRPFHGRIVTKWPRERVLDQLQSPLHRCCARVARLYNAASCLVSKGRHFPLNHCQCCIYFNAAESAENRSFVCSRHERPFASKLDQIGGGRCPSNPDPNRGARCSRVSGWAYAPTRQVTQIIRPAAADATCHLSFAGSWRTMATERR